MNEVEAGGRISNDRTGCGRCLEGATEVNLLKNEGRLTRP